DRQSGRIPSLDGLRALSISLVVFGHLGGTVGFPIGSPRLVLPFLAVLGVRVFFVISGYLITRLLLDEQEKRGSICLSMFYFRRIFRILVPYYVFLIAMAAAARLGWVELGPGDLGYALAYIGNYHPHSAWTLGHTWSLAVEEQFYVLWPLLVVGLLVAFRGRAGKRAICVVALIGGLASAVAMATLCRPHLWNRSGPARDGVRAGRYQRPSLAGCPLSGPAQIPLVLPRSARRARDHGVRATPPVCLHHFPGGHQRRRPTLRRPLRSPPRFHLDESAQRRTDRRRRARKLFDLPLAAALPEPIHFGPGNTVPGKHHRRRRGSDHRVLSRGEAGSGCPPGTGNQAAPRSAAAATAVRSPSVSGRSRGRRSLEIPVRRGQHACRHALTPSTCNPATVSFLPASIRTPKRLLERPLHVRTCGPSHEGRRFHPERRHRAVLRPVVPMPPEGAKVCGGATNAPLSR
ncbi:MAG: acyltransferase, partial [Deltaproteobacteria bacterium]